MKYVREGILPRVFAAVISCQALAGAALAQTSAPSTPVGYKLRLGSSSAVGDTGTTTSELFGRLAEAQSKGRLQFEFYPGGKLGTGDEIVAKVLRGEAEGFTESISNMTSKIPYAGLFEMPFVFASPLDTWMALDGPLGDAVKQDAEKLNLKILAFQDYGGRDFITAARPIVRAEDLAGLKMRSLATSPVQTKMYESWNSKPTPATIGQILDLMKKGEIDGFDFPAAAVEPRKFNEAAKYVTLVNLYRVVNPITVSKAWYDGLPKELQEVVVLSARMAADWGRLAQERERVGAVARLEKLGLKVNTLDAAEIGKLKAMLKPLFDDARKQYPKDIVDLTLGPQ